MDERTAIQKVKQGDWTGLQLLVENYQVRAVQSAMWILRDRDLAEEAAQCAFIRLAERISQYDETRPFSPWFFRSLLTKR
jgi:RNA polymerase sigma-70 factor (ECF subfamily)